MTVKTAGTSLRPLERSATTRVGRREQVWQLITLYRIGALVVAGVVLLSDASALTDAVRASWVGFAILAVAASTVHRFARAIPAAALITVETLAAAILLGAAPPGASALALYLLVPAFWAGVALRPFAAIATALVGSTISIALDLAIGSPGGDSLTPLNWAGLTVIAASLGAWTASIHQKRRRDDAAYERALGLLRELEEVTRRLPIGLDRSAVLNQCVASVRAVRPDAEVWIYSTPSETWGPEYATTEIDLGPATPGTPEWNTALSKRRAVPGRPDGTQGLSFVLLPLVYREVVVGMVRVGTPHAMPRRDLQDVEAHLASTPVQLLASSVFTQVRETAIAEERSRLSRQIHDGVAQDLAGMAFGLDAIAYGLPASAERDAMTRSAADVRRLVEELRFSIFDLRTGLGVDERLGTALAAYVHQVGERSGMRVHVEIDDVASASVPPQTAHELLRIAQEAVTNARRHSRAGRLWVVLRANADGLLLRVADDGSGLTSGVDRRAGDHVGLAIMSERAERLDGALEIRPRAGGGTVVECRLAAAATYAAHTTEAVSDAEIGTRELERAAPAIA